MSLHPRQRHPSKKWPASSTSHAVWPVRSGPGGWARKTGLHKVRGGLPSSGLMKSVCGSEYVTGELQGWAGEPSFRACCYWPAVLTAAPCSRPFALPFIYEIIPPICTWSFLGRMMHTRTAASFGLNCSAAQGDAP